MLQQFIIRKQPCTTLKSQIYFNKRADIDTELNLGLNLSQLNFKILLTTHSFDFFKYFQWAKQAVTSQQLLQGSSELIGLG